MTHKEIQPGDLVKLSKTSPFKATERFPVEGSEFECMGVVTEMRGEGGHNYKSHALVQWVNGAILSYHTSYLRAVSAEEVPLINTVKKDRNNYISIWKE